MPNPPRVLGKPHFIWNFLENIIPVEWLFSLYPPYLASGIRITKVKNHFRYVRVELGLSIYNQNYIGTHFGGSLFAMTDPFYMLMLIKNLGKNYIVWDKKACIDFVKASTESVYAEFTITQEDIDNIKEELKTKKSIEKTFLVEIKTRQKDDLVAKVKKTLYIRKRLR